MLINFRCSSDQLKPHPGAPMCELLVNTRYHPTVLKAGMSNLPSKWANGETKYIETDLKSPKLVPFVDNLIQFETRPDIQAASHSDILV